NGVGDFESLNYWIAPVAGGKSQKTEIAALLIQNNIPPFQFTPYRFDWRGQSLLFTAGSTVWGLDLPVGSLRPVNLRKITTGTSGLSGIRGTYTKFVFSSGTSTDHLWTLPLNLNSGKVTGPLQASPHAGGRQLWPASSADGRVFAYGQINPS